MMAEAAAVDKIPRKSVFEKSEESDILDISSRSANQADLEIIIPLSQDTQTTDYLEYTVTSIIYQKYLFSHL